MFNDILVFAWNESALGPLSMETIQRQHVPLEDYRVSRYQYPPNTTFKGAMQTGMVYVLQGECVYNYPQSAVIRLRHGQYAKLPAGEYELIVSDAGELVIVLAWHIPSAIAP